MHRRRLLGVSALMLALLIIWAGIHRYRAPGNAVRENLTITALSIGKADALIVQEADWVLLVDAGEPGDADEIVQELKSKGISRIDLFLVTHFDKDHVGGAAYVMEHMEVGSVLMPDYEGDRQEYRDFLESLQDHPEIHRVAELRRESMGGMEIAIYPAEDPGAIRDTADEYDNDLSLVASIRYGNRSFLLTGDIEKERIGQMLASDVDWRHDWIKMPHHGRYQKALAGLLEAVDPKSAVICCSRKNPPEEKTLTLLEEKGILVWDTSEQAVVTECDGETITVRYN